MATSKQVLAIAAGELGHTGGAKYWAGMGYGEGWYSQPWCCIFVDWVLKEAGMSIGSYANALTIQTGLKAAGAYQVSPKDAQAGDVLIFEWDHKGDTYDHVGFVEINKGTYLQTIEGNVSNTVGRRTRDYADVRQCWRPKYAANGWYKYNGKWYYLNDDGKALKNTWKKYNGQYYYLGANGYAVSNQWVKTSGKYYYCGSDGKPVTGWHTIDGKEYHFDNKAVCEYHTFAERNGALKYLGTDGAVVVNGDVPLKTDEDGYVYLA